jgi:siderophore synthetase component
MAVNDWITALVSGDAFLRASGFSLLREIAYVGYLHRHYERASNARHEPYKELLAAAFRESPVAALDVGERLMTMAALLHVDRDGNALLPCLVARSRLPVAEWLRAYLNAYLTPLLHCFYAHRLTFTPHCENVILVLKGDVPVRVFMKDLAEDIAVLNVETLLPESVRAIGLTVPEEVMTLVIFTDVFDCVFRFLVRILHEHLGFAETRFWALVAECILNYQRSQPDLAERFRRWDLFAPTFIRNCLNRLQLANNRQMVDLNAAEPVDSLKFAGTLENPIAAFARPSSAHSAGATSW